MSRDVFHVQTGTLYPALQRLLRRGWIAAEWSTTDAGRRAAALPADNGPAGSTLKRNARAWERASLAVRRIIERGVLRHVQARWVSVGACASCSSHPSLDADLNDELQQHFDHELSWQLASGVPEEEARRRARLRVGRLDLAREARRRGATVAASWPMRRATRAFAVRALRRNPGSTARRS